MKKIIAPLAAALVLAACGEQGPSEADLQAVTEDLALIERCNERDRLAARIIPA